MTLIFVLSPLSFQLFPVWKMVIFECVDSTFIIHGTIQTTLKFFALTSEKPCQSHQWKTDEPLDNVEPEKKNPYFSVILCPLSNLNCMANKLIISLCLSWLFFCCDCFPINFCSITYSMIRSWEHPAWIRKLLKNMSNLFCRFRFTNIYQEGKKIVNGYHTYSALYNHLFNMMHGTAVVIILFFCSSNCLQLTP